MDIHLNFNEMETTRNPAWLRGYKDYQLQNLDNPFNNDHESSRLKWYEGNDFAHQEALKEKEPNEEIQRVVATLMSAINELPDKILCAYLEAVCKEYPDHLCEHLEPLVKAFHADEREDDLGLTDIPEDIAYAWCEGYNSDHDVNPYPNTYYQPEEMRLYYAWLSGHAQNFMNTKTIKP